MSEIRRRTADMTDSDRNVNREETVTGAETHFSESVSETKRGEEIKPIQPEATPEQSDDKTNAENAINETKVLENATENDPVEKAKEETIISEEEEREQHCQSPEDQTKEKDDDLDAELHPDSTAAASLPVATDKTAEVLDTALKDLHPRWRNWIIRGIFTWVMILSFGFVIYLGPLALMLLVLLIQFKCFHEIITIGYVVYKSHELPWFRTLSWYFLITSNYFFYGESMAQYFGVLVSRTEFVKPFMTYHRFIAFSLYVSGFVAFVFSLVKKHYLKQFTLFGWTHVTLLIIVTQSHLLIQNIFEGLIWCLVPVTMIICNDIMAYMFGFFFGKTPLIKLSPKKTWEGFVGGAFATVIYGLIVSYVLVQFDFFVCPIRYNETKDVLSMECERSPEFTLTAYSLPYFVQKLGAMLAQDWKYLTVYPFILHSISMSLFASVLGPFGGFFASGFKRAFKIKDFADTIPGHGGFMDRFDCQLLMATFVHVYHSSFITAVGVQKLVQQILALKTEEQLEILEKLSASLTKRGVLASVKV